MTRSRATVSVSAALVSGDSLGWGGDGIPETRSVHPAA
mgnify:CR=1 FL=1